MATEGKSLDVFHGCNAFSLFAGVLTLFSSLQFVYRTPLHSSRKHLKAPTHKKWNVFGSVQAEGFDPLAFSKTMGDYPLGGVETGARWMALDNQIPERAAFDKKDEKH